jgi:lauroyl/myristoyl acyltransferase
MSVRANRVLALAPPATGHTVRPSRHDRLVRLAYRLGWRIAARLPRWLVRTAIRAASRVVLRRNGRHIRNLRRNLTVATGGPVGEDLMRAAVASYLRTFYEVLALPAWSPQQIQPMVVLVNEEIVRTALAGPGAVLAIAHSGNWDLAGAWACLNELPVTTVAEQLPDAEFADFLAFRQGLGMQVLSHRDPAVIPELTRAVRAHRLICLLADRDLSGAGLPVTWRGQPITMPVGPALLARRTGASLIPMVCRYTATGMTVKLCRPVPHRSGPDGLRAMTQDVADMLAEEIARQPEDWHMMQRFFPDPDVSESRAG